MELIFVDLGLRFILGLCLVVFAGAVIYNWWRRGYYGKPELSRTEVSLRIGEKTIYFPHIVSICEEYVSSRFLLLTGAALGFTVYLLLYLFLDLNTHGFVANVAVSAVSAAAGGAIGYTLGLSRKTVVRDSSGCSHVLHLRDLETIEFARELTKDLWDFYRRMGRR